MLTGVCRSSLVAQTLEKVDVNLEGLDPEEREQAVDLALRLLQTGGISPEIVT